ncbi:MAG TPA: prepilin-type N-terminal cleavage/methylation domain-containing protein, partial [Roseimicrobium sp.]|nr:prepilin-type N-terminal cleavage/methylation domain-containing protein [Roseimicrobium sp.]
MKHSSQYQKGFTRTELLVTLGVVALIAAITGAVVVQVGRKSTSYQCKANLKAIGVGMAMY